MIFVATKMLDKKFFPPPLLVLLLDPGSEIRDPRSGIRDPGWIFRYGSSRLENSQKNLSFCTKNRQIVPWSSLVIG
jgi:hypothetical protein